MFKENTGHLQQSILTSVSNMNNAVQKKLMNSWATVFYNMVFCKINEKIFSILYCNDTGRPNFPVNILLCLEYIKHLFNYSDAELVDQFYFNYQISYALGIKNVGEVNLAPGTLYEFRRRLYQYAADHYDVSDLIFAQFIELTQEFAKTAEIDVNEQRMDSTMISANIKNAGRLALAYDVLVQGIKSLPEETLTESLKEVLAEGYKNKLLYKCKTNQVVSKLEEILNKCIIVFEISNALPEAKETEGIRVLERFINEQTEIDVISKQRKIKENKNIKANSLQSAYDQDATYRKKAKKTGKGYSVNIAETCNEDNDIQLITDYDVKPNVINDTAFAEKRTPVLKANFDVKEVFVDGGYYSKEVEVIAKKNEINMHYTDMTGKKPEEDAITVDKFEINEDKTVDKCPMGFVPLSTSYMAEKDAILAYFAKETCNGCQFIHQCCITQQVKSNKFSSTTQAIAVQHKRNEIKNDIKVNCSKRTAIEGTNSELKRGHNLDDVAVIGIVKVSITTGLKITACNIKRFAQNAIKKLTKKPASPNINIPDNGIALQF